MRKAQHLDPFDRLAQEAEDWLEFGKHHKVHEDTMYWATKILIARDRQREIERKMSVERCIDEMICQRCTHELDCFCGCSCLCHEMV